MGRRNFVCPTTRCGAVALTVSFVLLLHAGNVHGYSTGALDSSCGPMVPNHDGAVPQTTPANFAITASSTSYTSGGPGITVTLAGSPYFEGFLLEARSATTNLPVGTYQNVPVDTHTICSTAGVTHSNNFKRTNVTLTWIPPSTNGIGKVFFIATFVQSKLTFWVNVTSTQLTEIVSGTAGSTVSTTPAPPLVDVNTTACGINGLACFRDPSGCDAASCNYVLTWSDAGTAIRFELSASVQNTEYWVGFGMSTDTSMGSDSVVSCVYDSATATVKVESSWNEGKSNDVYPDPQNGLVLDTISGAVSNGRMVCRFNRLKNVTLTATARRRRGTFGTPYPLDSGLYYILVAKGPTYFGSKNQHTDTSKSSNAVNFTAYTNADANESQLERNLIKAHGILMMFAWMVFASFGMLLPRYFKPAWPDKTWCGKKIWFQLHQPFMVLALLCTAAGFIIIFAAVREYSELPSPTVAHPPLGIIVMALVIINPIMALFRPDPNTKYRPMFNILHFCVGLLSHLAAVVTLFLGMYMTQLNLPMWCKGVMAAYICFHAVIEIVLAVHMHAAKFCKSNKREKEYEMTTAAGYQQAQSLNQGSGSGFKTTVLVIHLLGVLGLCIAISVQVGIS